MWVSTAICKHGGGSVMVWSCIWASVVWDLVKIGWIMNAGHHEHQIMIHLTTSHAGSIFVFRHDSDPKNTAKGAAEPGPSTEKRTKGLNVFYEAWELFLKTTWRNDNKDCIREFRLWRIKTVIPNITFLACTTSVFALYTIFLCMFPHVLINRCSHFPCNILRNNETCTVL